MVIKHVAPTRSVSDPGEPPRAAGATQWNTTRRRRELIIEDPEADE